MIRCACPRRCLVSVVCHIVCLTMTLNFDLTMSEELPNDGLSPVEEELKNPKNFVGFNQIDQPNENYSVAGPNALARNLLVERQERLQTNCDAIYHHQIITTDMFHHLLVDEQHNLLYCYVPKVACTNWKRVLMVATGKWPSQDPLEIPANLAHSTGIFKRLADYTIEEVEEKLATYNKLIVVRHPFERLLSAYRNKFESKYNSSRYFQERFGKRIVKMFRENATREALEKGDDVTFREFVDFVTAVTDTNGTQNEHWRPITELCHPCVVNYNFISRYETLVDDATEVLERMGVTGVRFPNGPQSTESTFQRLGRYFSTLRFEQLQRLAKMYKLDFKVFDYSLEEVLGFSLA